MTPITDNTRLMLWVITGIAAVLVTVFSIYLESNIRYVFRQIFSKTKGGRQPAKRSFFIWLIYGILIASSITGAAWAGSAPSLPEIIPTVTVQPLPNPTDTPQPTSTPPSIPMELVNKVQVVDTGIAGQICGYSKAHSIVRDLENNLHIFFTTAESPTTVFETVSQDNGETWSPASDISGFVVEGNIVGFSCSAAVDPLGNIHLLFDLSASDTAYTIWSSSTGWKRPVIRGQGLPDVGTFAANLATGPENQIHTVWSSRKIWYTFFDGSGWSSELDIAPGGWHPDIFVDVYNGRHVVYNDANFIPDKSGDGSSPVTVNYTYSSDGIHWSDPKVVPPDDGIWKGDAAIKVDTTGRRHITYTKWAQLEGDLYYTYSDDGQAWSLPEKLNTQPGVITGTTGSESAAMLLDQNNNLYVAWQGLGGSNPTKDNWLFMRWLNKATQKWSEPVEITQIAGGIGDQPSMPYQIYGWKDKNSFVLDIVWTSAGEIYYGQVKFLVTRIK